MNEEYQLESAGQPSCELELKQRLNSQTAKIAWTELARFFAAGKAIFVDSSLDLVEVAVSMHNDDASYIRGLMETSLLGQVPDDLAKLWSAQELSVWAVVVSPWVLVQESKPE